MMGLADPHCHTLASDGLVSAGDLVAAAIAAGLDLIAVCDHDTMDSIPAAVGAGEEAGLAVVAGQEVTTRWPAQVHVLGWFLERPVRSGLTLEDTVDAIHDQGGLAVIPHPFMPTYFASCQEDRLRRLLESRSVDGLETLFTAPTTAVRRARLADFYAANRERLGAELGASDSHFGAHDLGRVVTGFEGTTAADFRRSLAGRLTRPIPSRSSHIPAGLIARQQWRSLVQLPWRRLRGQLE